MTLTHIVKTYLYLFMTEFLQYITNRNRGIYYDSCRDNRRNLIKYAARGIGIFRGKLWSHVVRTG